MRYLKRHWRRIVLSSVPMVLILLHSLGVFPIAVLDRLDAIIYDARLRASMPNTFDDRIVIVDIDEKSLAEIGRWPWSRHKLAALTDTLFDKQQIALLGFDVVFAESDESSGLKLLQRLAHNELRDETGFIRQLKNISPRLDFDTTFAASLKNRSLVMGYYFSNDHDGRTTGVLPKPVMGPQDFPDHRSTLSDWNGYGSNIIQLAHVAPMAGFFNSLTDPDGVVRALPLVVRHADNYYEALSLAMFRSLIGMPKVAPEFAQTTSTDSQSDALQSIVLKWADKTYSIPVDQRAALLIPFRGPGGARGGSFEYVSASDVLAGRVVDAHLKGKIVLLGTTALGIVDLHATPVAAVYPGVEVHANALASLIDRRFLVRPVNAGSYEVLLILLVGLTLTLALPKLRAPVAVMLSVAVLAGLTAMNWWLFLSHSLVLSLAPLLLMALTVFVLNVGYGYLVASRSRRELVQLFGTYVPPELVREMIKDPDRYTMQARSDELTVMFCDMRGFTSMSERLNPVELQQLLNQVFSELTRLIGANRGTVDKYMGDCVMAFWGAPVESPLHAQLAVKTALEISQALGRINQAHKAGALGRVGLNIGLGIGLNTGQMYVGDMGSDIRRSYTVIGDAVNLGARLEGLSKVYGVNIVASDATRLLATGFIWQELDRVRVKGRLQALTIYTPLAATGEFTSVQNEELVLWHSFLARYRDQDWVQCNFLLDQLLQKDCQKLLYLLYSQRIARMREQPADPNWDGATNFETK